MLFQALLQRLPLRSRHGQRLQVLVSHSNVLPRGPRTGRRRPTRGLLAALQQQCIGFSVGGGPMGRQHSSHSSADRSQSVLRAFIVKPPHWLAMGRVPDLARLALWTNVGHSWRLSLDAFPSLAVPSLLSLSSLLLPLIPGIHPLLPLEIFDRRLSGPGLRSFDLGLIPQNGTVSFEPQVPGGRQCEAGIRYFPGVSAAESRILSRGLSCTLMRLQDLCLLQYACPPGRFANCTRLFSQVVVVKAPPAIPPKRLQTSCEL